MGWKGILWTAWLGTPFHELGHWLLAKLFRHRISRMAIFQPNEKTGELGQVCHTFNPASLYQKIGNFFIGAAPLIFGSTVLALLAYFLLPNGKQTFLLLLATGHSPTSILASLPKILANFFAPEHIQTWPFWLFLYLSFAIASHLAPSKADRRGMWAGLGWIILLLALINTFAILFKFDLTQYLKRTSQYLSILTVIFIYALIISATHWALSAVILTPIRWLRRGQ